MEPRNAKEEYLARQVQSLMPQLPIGAVRLRVLDLFRADMFQGLLADAILQRLQPGRFPRQAGMEPPAAIAILLSRFSDKAVKLAQEYVACFCPKLDWVVMDVKGRACYSFRGQLQEQQLEPYMLAEAVAESAAPRRLFSANNQWFLKVLLLEGMASDYWGVPASAKIRGVSDLARVANKPQSSASSFRQIAEEQGWLSNGADGFVLHRLPQLLDQWSFYLQNNPDLSLPVASIYPGEGVEELLQRVRGADDVVVGGHYAAHALGLGISNHKVPRLHVRNLADSLHRFSLVKAAADRAIAIMALPKAADTVFRSAVEDAQGLQLADILQVYLDARLSLARGDEQAEHIFEQVLAPHFRERRWL